MISIVLLIAFVRKAKNEHETGIDLKVEFIPDSVTTKPKLMCNKCELNWSPVCGIDGNTHLNECKAKCLDIEILCHQSCPCPNYPVMEELYVFKHNIKNRDINGCDKCLTPDQSCQTMNDKECQFPFWYQGVKYPMCMYSSKGENEGKYVCPTKVLFHN